jgi:hypothetical protein
MQAQRLARGIVQAQAQGLEAYHLAQPAGQVTEQRVQVAVGDHRFRDRQEGLVRLR